MSIDWYEAQQEQAYSEFVDSLYEEHKQRAIEEFMSDRVASYYVKHPDVCVQVFAFLKKAKFFQESDPTGSLLYSSTATEVLLKAAILKPIVYGLVHTESLAELIATQLLNQSGVDRFKDLVFRILDHHIEFEDGICSYCRDGSQTPLWQERQTIHSVRNAILHKAQPSAPAQAHLSLEIAVAFVTLTSVLLNRMGLAFSNELVVHKTG